MPIRKADFEVGREPQSQDSEVLTFLLEQRQTVLL